MKADKTNVATIDNGTDAFHIRLLSVVPVDLANLLAELEAESKEV